MTDPIAVWDWLQETTSLLRRSAWRPALEVEGVDLLDALLVPLYQDALALAREGEGAGTPDRSWESRPLPRATAAARRLLRGRPPGRWRRWRASAQGTPPRPAPLAFWPRTHNHVEVHAPVAAALAAQGVQSIFLTAAPAPFEEARRQGLAVTWPPRAWPQQLAKGTDWAARQATALAFDPGTQLPNLPGCSREPLDLLRRTLQRQLPDVCAAAITADALFETVQPQVLVVGNDLTLEGRTATLLARQRGIATGCLMHGLVNREPLHGAHIADRFLLYGERSRRQLLDLGASAETLVVCGCPKLDPPPRQRHRPDRRLRRLGVHAGRPWVLVATSGPGHSVSWRHHQRLVAALARLSRNRPDIRFVVKLHPKDRRALYRAERAPWVVVEHGTRGLPGEIFDWLQGCTAVITGASTVAVEAMLLDVPVITLDLAGELEAVDFIDEGATLHATTEPAVAAALDAVLEGSAAIQGTLDNARRFAAETFHQPPEGATAKAATALLELLPGEGG